MDLPEKKGLDKIMDKKNSKDIKNIKIEYYSRNDVVENYDKFRFSGAGGFYEDSKEKETVEELLNKSNINRNVLLLDCPCGTGRMFHIANQENIKIHACDRSYAMLKYIKKNFNKKFSGNALNTDIFNLPFNNCVFDYMLSIRFIFHLPDLEKFLGEAGRILKKDGVLIFDTINWSPKFLIPHGKILSGEMFYHSAERIKNVSARYGFEIIDNSHCFILPSFVYKFIPDFPLKIIKWIEKKNWVKSFMTKTFWCMKKK